MIPAHTQAERYAAHLLVKKALYRGELTRPRLCEDCGILPDHTLQGHHEDYSKPLSVVWVCTSCHGKRHTDAKDPRAVPTTFRSPRPLWKRVRSLATDRRVSAHSLWIEAISQYLEREAA